MKRGRAPALLLAFVLASAAAFAQDRTARNIVAQNIEPKLPPHWQLHVSEREKILLVSLMPPYQEAFDLWYDPQRQAAVLRQLCPAAGEEIWKLLGSDRDVVLQPTVGGKSVPEAQVSCRRLSGLAN